MWGFAHLYARSGAFSVTTTLQKSQGMDGLHNVAHAFEKPRRLVASVQCARRNRDRSLALHFRHAETERI